MQRGQLAAEDVDDGEPQPNDEEDEPWWTNSKQSRGALPKNLILPLAVQDFTMMTVPETCSPDRRCTPAEGMK